MWFKFVSREPHTQCMSFLCLTATFYWFVFLFPVLCPLLADWALCCMLVVMSQFECSQTVSRTMGIQVNEGKVNPLTHKHLSSPIISQRQLATLLTHIQTQFPFHGPNEGNLSGREWASSTNSVAEASSLDVCAVASFSSICAIPTNTPSLSGVMLATCTLCSLPETLSVGWFGKDFLTFDCHSFNQWWTLYLGVTLAPFAPAVHSKV